MIRIDPELNQRRRQLAHPRHEDQPDDDDSSSSSSSIMSISTIHSGGSISDESELDVTHTLDQLANNDPDLTSLSMRSIVHTFDNYNVDEWRRLGLAVGRDTNLEMVSFHRMYLNDSDRNNIITRANYGEMFRGLVKNKSIRDIDFLQCELFGGWVFPHLAPLFERCTQITIEDCELGREGRLLLAKALDTCRTSSLEEINLDELDLGGDNESFAHFVNALKVHTKLEKISLGRNNIGTTSTCRALSRLLRDNSSLIALDLRENNIHCDGVAILALGLKDETSTITHLNLSNNNIERLGWQTLAGVLRSSCSRLMSLSLNDNFMDDDASIALASSLGDNNTLTDLYLDNTRITMPGLQAFSQLLQQNTGLKHLSLRKNRINNRGAITLADSLTNNNVLTRLNLEFDISITSKGWKAFSRLLCRRSSIADTHRSNHTLQKLIGDDEYTLSGDLMLLLLMNRDADKSRVARRKINKCHFAGNFDVQPFVGMNMETLPYIISWMGQDEVSLLFSFIKNTQSFFDFSDGVKEDRCICGPTDDVISEKIQLQSVLQCPKSYVGEWWYE